MIEKDSLRVVLCTAPQRVTTSRYDGEDPVTPKIAIVSLVKWMERAGFHGSFIDIDMLLPPPDRISDYFTQREPHVVGISAVVSTSYLQVKRLADQIRGSCPNVVIVLGGNMAVSANLLLRKTEIDICVLGDGELPWVEILEHVSMNDGGLVPEQMGAMKGLAYLDARGEMVFTGYSKPIPAETNPFPDYALMKQGLQGEDGLMSLYFKSVKGNDWFGRDPRTSEVGRPSLIASAWVGKGCVARCTFCQRFCQGYRVFDICAFDSYLGDLKTKQGVGFFIVAGENFGLPREFAHKVAETLKKHDMLWTAGAARCTNFKPEDYRFFRECGCVGIKFGVESGSNKILAVMEKRFKVEDVRKAIEEATAAGLYAPVSFCIGMPGETDETIAETGRFLGEMYRLQGIHPVGIFYALALPGAALYEYGQLQGVIGTTPDEEEEYLTYVSDKDTSKDFYVNMSGTSNRHALFWDHLIFYEAMRTYYASTSIPGRAQPAAAASRSESGDNTRKSRPFRILDIVHQFSFRRLAYLLFLEPVGTLNKVLCRSRWGTFFPRWLLYPVMRNLLYMEYCLHVACRWVRSLVVKDEWFAMRRKFATRACRSPVVPDVSLRVINEQLRKQRPAPATLSEKNQAILYQGR